MLIARGVGRARGEEGVVDIVNTETSDVANVVNRDDGAVVDPAVDSFDGYVAVYRI